MRITVFGATGQVGKRIIRQALAMGHQVTAFGRNVESLIDADIRNDNLIAVKGYVFDAGDVFNAVKDAEAVISALGGAIDGNDKTRSLGMKNIVEQMQQSGVQRLMVVASMGLLKDDEYEFRMNRPNYPKVFQFVGEEHKQAFSYIRHSGLNWTIVCPPEIIDADASGNYITALDYPPVPTKMQINAGDIASFMIDAINNPQFYNKRVGICTA